MFYLLKNNSIEIKVNSFGAELCSVKSVSDNLEYLWQANKSVWARHAPNLFPIVGKLKNNTYSYNNVNYGLPQHGFARDSEFTCVEETNHVLVLELVGNETLQKMYPFLFSFRVIYTLSNNAIKVTYRVFNTDNKALFFSVGAHPAFNCPLTSHETFEDYELLFPNKDQLIINTLKDGLISNDTKTIQLKNNRIAVSTSLFDNDALVFANNQINEVCLQSTKTKKSVTLKSANWPYFGIWTKKQSNQFICLESWYGIADFENTTQQLTEKKGIIKLEADHFFNCEYEMIFD